MTDNPALGILRKRVVTGLIQAVVLFGILFSISFLQGDDAGQAAFSRAAVFSLLLVFGYSVNRLFNDLQRRKVAGICYRGATSIGMIVAGAGLWQLLVSFDEYRVWPSRYALILLCGLVTLSLSRLAGYREGREGGIVFGFLGWLEGKPSIKFAYGITIGVYLVYLRPYLGIDPSTQIILEWLLFCILGIGILIRVWSGVSKETDEDDSDKHWRKHEPEIERFIGTTHEALIRTERQFINIGEPGTLYVLLTVLLYENGIRESEIVAAVAPLMNFKGINQARQNQLHLTPRARRQQRALRDEALKVTFDEIHSMNILNRSRVNGKLMQLESLDTLELNQPIDGLRRKFLAGEDRSGLFTRLIIILHTGGRYHEHIVSALRTLTDDLGNPSDFALKHLLTNIRANGEVPRAVP